MGHCCMSPSQKLSRLVCEVWPRCDCPVPWQDEDALVQEWGVGAMAANPDEHIPEAAETQCLAIVDLDWDKVRAVDILAVLRSFLIKGQTITAVSVYPSDFGLQKMKEEAAVGPQVSICHDSIQQA